MKIRITRDQWRWLIAAGMVGILVYLGVTHFHHKYPYPFFAILAILVVLLLFAFRRLGGGKE